MDRVRKAVVLAAGYGTRFLPSTKTLPKELFPLIDTPAISYIINELIAAGITEILIVTSRRKRALEDLFDREVELESVFTAERATAKLKLIEAPQANVYFLRQPKMGGTGDALLLVESWVGNESFVVAYPDDIVLADPGLSSQLIDVYNRTGRTVLAGQALPENMDVSRYGVVGFNMVGDNNIVTAMIEKPASGTEPSRVVSYGRYLYTADLWPALHAAQEAFTGPGELTQTHALRLMLETQRVALCQFTGRVLDVGSPMGYVEAMLEMALLRHEYGEQTRALISRIARRDGLS